MTRSLALRNVWRIEGNNVMKRMGELRSGTEAGKGRHLGALLSG